ncbi:hypothetical protein CPLU01_00983 [Colletotrichum plurivorum]|uniref:Uncharacterized protein n=1 Tax=Colletotrichum plurivorum TaxID=2175906 RepID=A0A8H6NQB2_9PEZI|nr:hypothetical protein CPLU01_00983 [Colletotrichum plurivorum]
MPPLLEERVRNYTPGPRSPPKPTLWARQTVPLEWKPPLTDRGEGELVHLSQSSCEDEVDGGLGHEPETCPLSQASSFGSSLQRHRCTSPTLITIQHQRLLFIRSFDASLSLNSCV